jgi:Flp pilus assembly protein TadD
VLAPEEPNAHFVVGYAAARLKQRRAAVAAYQRVLSLRPDHALALNNRSALHMRRGRLLTAARGLRVAVASQPDLRIAKYNLRVLASGFVRWLQFGVLALFLLMGILRPQSQTWVTKWPVWA